MVTGCELTTVAIVVGATLSIGGVAAAVTGDPFAPVKGIVTAMGGHGAEQHPGKARAFGADKQARSQLRHGDLVGAQASLAAMKAELLRDDLSSGDRQAIEAHIAALQKQVDHAVATAADPQGGADGNGNGKTDDGTGANGKATGDTKGTGGKPTSGRRASRRPPARPSRGPASRAGAGEGRSPTRQLTRRPTRSSPARRPVAPAVRVSPPPRPIDPEDAPATATATADPSEPSGATRPEHRRCHEGLLHEGRLHHPVSRAGAA